MVFERLRAGLERTRSHMRDMLNTVLSGGRRVDDELFDEIEETMIQADMGFATAHALVEELRQRCRNERITDSEAVMPLIRDVVEDRLRQGTSDLLTDQTPAVIMIVGVNGSGKTTTCAKLAHRFRTDKKRVILGAVDTFRAAAIDQLEVWAQRTGADIIRHQEGSDPAAVAFDAIAAGIARRADAVILDTAGRMHTRSDLMKELGKVRRVAGKALPGAPHEVLLVLDATTGQNAMRQAEEFQSVTELTGIILTKLDGSARGGVVVSIVDQLGIPVKMIGIGEGMDDLRPFDAAEFVEAIFG